MKNLIKSIILILLLQGCSRDYDKTERNHEILNLILNDRLPLEYNMCVIEESHDSIYIGKLTLIGISESELEIDTVKNRLGIFSYHSVPFEHPFYKNSKEYILNQISEMRPTLWDSLLIKSRIEIEMPELNVENETNNKIRFWIATHPNENYLVVSEPIENINGAVTVSAKIFMKKYNIDKSYILSRVDGKWSIEESTTAVSKNIGKTYDDRTEVVEMFMGYYDI